MKIFITGATGFIGSHLTKLLVSQGHEITALLRTESKRKRLPNSIQIIKGDLTIFQDLNFQLPPFDVIIHLAGVIFAPDDATYMKYNFIAVKDLVKCIQRQNWNLKRFIFASSLAGAGPSNGTIALTEKDTPKPIDVYGRAKFAAEEFLTTITDFPTTSFRPAIVFGPGDENTLTLFQMAQKRLGMSVNGKTQYLSFVDIKDLNQAILKMIMDNSKGHRQYFVAHSSLISNQLLFKTLGVVMNRKVFVIPVPKPLLYIAMQVFTLFANFLGIKNQLDNKQYLELMYHFVCSGKALEKDLGWKPQYDLLMSLQKAYEGYKAEGSL